VTVYALIQDNSLEGCSTLCGVYASVELAKAAAGAREKPTSDWRDDGTADCGLWVQWTITAHDIDGDLVEP
jgi:hypothetical protein